VIGKTNIGAEHRFFRKSSKVSSMHETKRSGQFVVPGDKIGVIEEFISGSGTYVEEGSIFSKVVGRMLLDWVDKKVSIYPLARSVIAPRVGNTVIGNATNVQDSTAQIRMFLIGTEHLSGFFSGILHVSDASFRYVDSMFDICRRGDIVRAKVISDKNGTYHLSTKGDNLGVILAFCSSCGSLLTRKRAKMVCEVCGNAEKRHAALDYGEGAI